MKNKDKYSLNELEFRPMYQVNGCGKKIDGSCTVEVWYRDKRIDNIVFKEHMLPKIMSWLEKEA